MTGKQGNESDILNEHLMCGAVRAAEYIRGDPWSRNGTSCCPEFIKSLQEHYIDGASRSINSPRVIDWKLMMGNCTPRKPEVRLPHTLSRVSRGLAFCGHLPQLPSLLCPPSWPPRARTKPSGSDWEGNRRRDRGMGKAAQRNSSHQAP